MGYLIKGDRAHKESPPHDLDTTNCRRESSIPSGVEKCNICFGMSTR